jgi:hypothetical protein
VGASGNPQKEFLETPCDWHEKEIPALDCDDFSDWWVSRIFNVLRVADTGVKM